MTELLTASRIAALQRCPRAHYWRYEVGLRAAKPADALRFGSAWHRAMEARAKGSCYEQALEYAIGDRAEVDELQVATLAGMLAGYWHRWGESDGQAVAEVEFSHPLGRGVRMHAAGKIDAIAHDYLVEHKTAGCDIAPDSDYWLRLRGNVQVIMYVDAARRMGFDPRCLLYDVARKPAIRPKQGETVEQYGDRLTTDTMERPDFYFARREVPIIEQDIERFRRERLDMVSEILWRRGRNAWPRAVSERTCNTCEFAGFCLQGVDDIGQNAPAGFVVGQKHAELSAEKGAE